MWGRSWGAMVTLCGGRESVSTHLAAAAGTLDGRTSTCHLTVTEAAPVTEEYKVILSSNSCDV